jgi:hypothetical protein
MCGILNVGPALKNVIHLLNWETKYENTAWIKTTRRMLANYYEINMIIPHVYFGITDS